VEVVELGINHLVMKPQYKVGQKIRMWNYTFSDNIKGYQEGYIVAIEPFTQESVRCYFKVTKQVLFDEVLFIPEGETRQFTSSILRPPVVLVGFFEVQKPYRATNRLYDIRLPKN